MKRLIIITFLALASTFFANAQKLFTGTIKYDLSYGEGVDRSQMSVLPSTSTVLYGDKFMKTSQASAFYTQEVIINQKDNLMHILFSMMGQKMAVESPIDITQVNESLEMFDVKKTNTTKDILGYTCTLYKVSYKDNNQDLNADFYVCEDIYNPITMFTQDMPKIDGIPLEYTVNAAGILITMTAKEVEKHKVADKEFEVPEGYEKMSMEDLQRMGGRF